jgi:hypothetical protein
MDVGVDGHHGADAVRRHREMLGHSGGRAVLERFVTVEPDT